MNHGKQSRIQRQLYSLLKHRARNWLLGGIALYAVLGFLIAPWLLKKTAVSTVEETLGVELRLEKVAINPFFLSLRVEGIELDDPQGSPTFTAAEFFANFQLSSIFRLAWTFDEIRLTSPEIFVARAGSGELNLAYLAGEPRPAEVTDENADSEPAPLLVFNFAIENCAINWQDMVPVDPVDTRFGPINIAISDLNTLPARSGQQDVVITTETQGTLSWNGDLQLNPLKSTAHASVKGSHFPLTSAYIKHQSGFDIVDGNADVELDYAIDTLDDGSLSLIVSNFNLVFSDVAVETFSVNQAADKPDSEVLRLPRVELANGSLDLLSREVTLESLTVDDAAISLVRDENGEFNIVRKSPSAADPDSSTSESVADDTGSGDDRPWKLSLENLAVNRLNLDLDDHSVSPFADVGIENFNLAVSNIDNQPGSSFPTSLDLQIRSGGSLSMAGTIAALPELAVEFEANLENIALAGAHPYIKPLADVSLDSGAVNLTGSIASNGDEALSFAGDIEIADLSIAETDEGSRLGSWDSLQAKTIVLSLTKQQLSISELAFERPYGDIVIDENGGLNLGRVSKRDAGEEGETESADDQAEEEPEAESPFGVTIGKVQLVNASADFADFSLPLPFAVRIEELNGDLTTIATSSSEPSVVQMEGKVDEFGFVRISGSATPLDLTLNTDLLVAFQNVDMPKFTSYTVPFAGREIASGSLDLDLGYRVTESQLVGDNNILLRNLELGDKVEHPGAMSLPLGLAVALLKDGDGNIDIDLPVSGDVNDPEFSYGGVIWKALGNLIVNIVTSPFALLGKLVGVESSELEHLNFLDGRSDLTPPEQQKILKLAEALSLRPQLTLELAGPYDIEQDGLALRTAQLDAMVEERISLLEAAAGNEGMYAEQQKMVLESMFTELQPAEALDSIRMQFITPASEEETEATLDELAFVNEVRRQLIELQQLSDADLAQLAGERASNVQAALLETDPTLANRINIVEVEAITRDTGEPLQMNVTLAVAEDE